MKKVLLISVGLGFCLCVVPKIFAQVKPTANTDLERKLESGRQQVIKARQKLKQGSRAAKTEESQLRQEIKTAVIEQNTQKEEWLKAKFKAAHMRNVKQKQKDKEGISSARHKLKTDVKEAHQKSKSNAKAPSLLNKKAYSVEEKWGKEKK